MNEKLYNNKVTKIAKIMSLESKVNIVGSVKIKRSIFTLLSRLIILAIFVTLLLYSYENC